MSKSIGERLSVRSVSQSQENRRSFPEGKTFLWLVGGFILCRFLTDNFLPAIGLRHFAQQAAALVDYFAPYLLLPVCLVLVIQTWCRNILAGLLVATGSLILDFYFFIHFNDPPSWGSLVLIALGAAVSYAAYAVGRPGFREAPPSSDAARQRVWRTCAIVYLMSAVATGLAELLLKHNGARWDVPIALPIIPTIFTLAAYLILIRSAPDHDTESMPAKAHSMS
ncbi:MAG: hypothetical protein ACR2PL_09160 [Dehalococcoidia bacterium]